MAGDTKKLLSLVAFPRRACSSQRWIFGQIAERPQEFFDKLEQQN